MRIHSVTISSKAYDELGTIGVARLMRFLFKDALYDVAYIYGTWETVFTRSKTDE